MKRPDAGFTLLEVLMVTGLLAFVALGIFVSVRSMMESKSRVDAQSESTQEFRAIVGLLTRDISTAFFNTADDLVWNPLKKEADPITGQIPPQSTAPTPITIFYGKENEVFLSARSHQRLAANSPENEQHFITYQLQDKKLIRAESSRAVNLYDREEPTKFKSTVLLDRVNSIKFRYWDVKTGNWTDSWDTESATYRDRLPGAVDVELTIAPRPREENDTRKSKAKEMVISTAITITNTMLGQGAFK